VIKPADFTTTYHPVSCFCTLVMTAFLQNDSSSFWRAL